MAVTTERIEINPAVMLGKPVIRGTRITVELILNKLAEGETESELLEDYPHLTPEDIRAAIAYGAASVAHEEVVLLADPSKSDKPWNVEFVADESCAAPVIRALRIAGHDVIAVAEVSKGIPDEQVIERALNERRVLVTEDADFGELIYARGQPSAGVIFVKFHRRVRDAKPGAVVEAVTKLGEQLRGAFTVVEPGRVRAGRRPRS
jgi:uncharacterized protein (DUF433 family)